MPAGVGAITAAPVVFSSGEQNTDFLQLLLIKTTPTAINTVVAKS